MKCNKCQDDLSVSGESVVCGLCSGSFHYDCSVRETKWRNWSVEQRSKWTCLTCKGSSSQASSVASSQGDEAALGDPGVKALLLRINSRLDTLDAVKRSVDSMETSLEFLSQRYDDLLQEVKTCKEASAETSKEVERLKAENARKDEELSLLTRRFNALEQYGRGVNLEIHGLDESVADESSEVVLRRVAAAIGQPFNMAEVQAAHRMRSSNRDRPDIFLVQFVSKAVKERWLVAGKRRRLLSKDIVDTGEHRVYFNENLTPFYRRLLMETKKRAKEKGYASVWTTNGHIRVRKNADARKIFTIVTYDDLNQLV